MLDFSSVTNISSASITVVSILVSIFVFRKNRKLQKELKSFKWEKVHSSSLELGKIIKKDFSPDVILTYTPRSGIIALLLRDLVNVKSPVFVGVVFHKKSPIGFAPSHFWKVETNKMDIFIPDALLDYIDKKILIVDEYTLTGDSLSVLKSFLIQKGFNEKKIRTASLIKTTTAEISKKSPDYSFFTVDYTDFYLPWGKAL